jgi:hypothetical protein
MQHMNSERVTVPAYPRYAVAVPLPLLREVVDEAKYLFAADAGKLRHLGTIGALARVSPARISPIDPRRLPELSGARGGWGEAGGRY